MPARGRCAIFGTPDRPEFCSAYPQPDDWRPIACTYSFDAAGERSGECDAYACREENCCNFPREDGEPTAQFTPSGRPCQHLTGLERRPASKRFAQVTASALWVRDVCLERRKGEQWALRFVPGGVGQWTLLGLSDASLKQHSKRDGAIAFTVSMPGRPALPVDLTPAEATALWLLNPAPSPEEEEQARLRASAATPESLEV